MRCGDCKYLGKEIVYRRLGKMDEYENQRVIINANMCKNEQKTWRNSLKINRYVLLKMVAVYKECFEGKGRLWLYWF